MKCNNLDCRRLSVSQAGVLEVWNDGESWDEQSSPSADVGVIFLDEQREFEAVDVESESIRQSDSDVVFEVFIDGRIRDVEHEDVIGELAFFQSFALRVPFDFCDEVVHWVPFQKLYRGHAAQAGVYRISCGL